MFRIDNPTAVPALPIVPPPGTPGFFTNGNPQQGLDPTNVDDWFLNMLQEEILTVVIKAGLVPNKNDNTQLWQALLIFNPRQSLTGPTTFYVNGSTGSDNNTGLTAGSAWQTLQHAANFLVNHTDFNGQNVTVNIADGTYGPFAQSGNPLGCFSGNALVYSGNVSNPSAVVIETATPELSAITFSDGAQATLQGVTLTTTSGNNFSHGLLVQGGSYAEVQNINCGPCSGGHLTASVGANILLAGAYTISGGAKTHLQAIYGASIGCGGEVGPGNPPFSVTVSGTPAFSQAFAVSWYTGAISMVPGVLTGFVGSATGQRYSVIGGATITVNGGGIDFFPGSIAGVADPTSYGSYIA